MKTIDDMNIIWTGDEDGGEWWEKEKDGYAKTILNPESDCLDGIISTEELKQSAIEDIKELKKEAKERDSDFGLRDIDKGSYIGKIEYIEKKFNIKK